VRERERVCVCVCVRERDRERERGGGGRATETKDKQSVIKYLCVHCTSHIFQIRLHTRLDDGSIVIDTRYVGHLTTLSDTEHLNFTTST
jgi:hypothetical protein